jgi:hypothetical protein
MLAKNLAKNLFDGQNSILIAKNLDNKPVLGALSFSRMASPNTAAKKVAHYRSRALLTSEDVS